MSALQFEDNGILRFTTAGSVDDGKSSLIGRLLYDANVVPDDQIKALERTAQRKGEEAIDLSLLTDGLTAEREQGITIDVAYRYFATAKRKFIIADTPGHEQYTRNMVTGASTADAAVILVDARKSMTVQTRRHLYLAHLLGIPHLIVAVNKMDLVGFDQATFASVSDSVTAFATALGAQRPILIPVSAKFGDNVVKASERTSWYGGQPLLAVLEELPQAVRLQHTPFRFPVQLVRRVPAAEGGQSRVYSGRIESGSVAVGDEITVLPAGNRTRVRAISTFDGPLERAFAPQSVNIEVADDIDIARGDLFAPAAAPSRTGDKVEATLCWFSDDAYQGGGRYAVKQGTRTIQARIAAIAHRFDVANLANEATTSLQRNDIARVTLQFAQPIAFDAYHDNRSTGAFILIDEYTNATVAAGMIAA
ncbi:MAG TPA: GTP-binding protein [Alphaproteobacteria bacterium]|jgi:sulfate adenylyltransferase subunit 1|nr:GTP-binding protein [Alphaproteobacteria bacterium]